MQKHDFSKHDDYHTQRNNARWPHGTCLATSLVMAAKQAGWAVDQVPDGVQPEDEIAELCHSTEARDLIETEYPWALDTEGNLTVAPHTIHGVANWALRQVLAREVEQTRRTARFETSLMLDEVVDMVSRGYGIALSGSFDLENGDSLNHVVSIAGFTVAEGEDLPEGITKLIIDDPYGNYHTGYRDVHGNGIEMAFGSGGALDIFKPVGEEAKWAHIVAPKGAA